jgi:hypothetical protein
MKFVLYIAFVAILPAIASCDKEHQPVIIKTSLDTALYPGNFLDYVPPTFDQNTNTDKNVLIEDYTGHTCSFCPASNAIAQNIETDNEGRVFAISIHAGPDQNGYGSKQQTENNADGSYSRNFTTPEGREMATFFAAGSYGFDANPAGTINRNYYSGQMFVNSPVWDQMTDSVLTTPLEINLQAKSNYFQETDAVFLHVETEFITDLKGKYNVVVYAVQDEIIDWQYDWALGDIPDYKHHNVHIGNVFNETWGRSVGSGEIAGGTKVVTDFSYKIPVGITKDDMHFVIYVYKRDTYEVMQVIDHHF